MTTQTPGEVGELPVEAFRILQEGGVSYALVPGGFGGGAGGEDVLTRLPAS